MKKDKGFTIVEMLLYMSLLTVFVFVLVELLTTILKTQLKNETLSSYAQDTRYIMQKMFYDFNNTNDIDATIGLYTIDPNGRLMYASEYLNSIDTTMENLSFTKIDNSVQVKFDMNGQNFQTTFNKR